MIPATTFEGRRVAVFGLGRSGGATCRALAAGGAEVLAWDENERARAAAEADGIALTDLVRADWPTIDTLVLAPGVPLTHPAPHWTVNRARDAGVEVIGDVEVFARERRAIAPQAPFIAITGTNGKSTTTALIAHMLGDAGCDVQMGGNIGVPILSLAPPAPGRHYVIEMSSYQIDLTPTLESDVAILLNVSPDHIDRHGTFDNYAKIKAHLVQAGKCAVIGVDDATVTEIAARLAASGQNMVRFSADHGLAAGYYLDGDHIYLAEDGHSAPVANVDGLATLRGRHNVRNVMAALATMKSLGVAFKDATRALKSFPGLAHRLELVGHRGRTLFINDSKATNVEAAAVALASLEGDIFWILGGRAKEGGLADLKRFFPRIARAYLIGEAEQAFEADLEGKVDTVRCGTLAKALDRAAADAEASGAEEPVVLLAPACASFDQFPNFEARGTEFRELAMALPGFVALGGGV